MSTCATPGCGYQHGLVNGVCTDCELYDEVIENERVLRRVQRDSTRPEFGSSPHDEGVLTVVLVMTGGLSASDVRVRVVEPNTPHAEQFWQDIGREYVGHERSVEAPVADESVQRACPTWPNGDLRYPARGIAPKPVPPPMSAATAFSESRQLGDPSDYTDRFVRAPGPIPEKAGPHYAAWSPTERCPWPTATVSRELGCTCQWWGRSITQFDAACPILTYHKCSPRPLKRWTLPPGGRYLARGIQEHCNAFWEVRRPSNQSREPIPEEGP